MKVSLFSGHFKEFIKAFFTRPERRTVTTDDGPRWTLAAVVAELNAAGGAVNRPMIQRDIHAGFTHAAVTVGVEVVAHNDSAPVKVGGSQVGKSRGETVAHSLTSWIPKGRRSW